MGPSEAGREPGETGVIAGGGWETGEGQQCQSLSGTRRAEHWKLEGVRHRWRDWRSGSAVGPERLVPPPHPSECQSLL